MNDYYLMSDEHYQNDDLEDYFELLLEFKVKYQQYIPFRLAIHG